MFLSRGDNSGTHYKEKQVWEKTGLIPTRNDEWYLSTGSGLGATINTAVAKNGYTFSDRATWLSYKNKNKFEILLEGDPELFNQYSLIPINADLHPHVRKEKAYEFIRWLTSDQGQNLIKNFKMKLIKEFKEGKIYELEDYKKNIHFEFADFFLKKYPNLNELIIRNLYSNNKNKGEIGLILLSDNFFESDNFSLPEYLITKYKFRIININLIEI